MLDLEQNTWVRGWVLTFRTLTLHGSVSAEGKRDDLGS